MKDNFSNQATTYAQFRPDYPTELFDFILQNVENKQVAWDVATGNGQAAKILAAHFKQIVATDLSQKQIDNAVKLPNIKYAVGRAEATDFADNSFDLITVAQAVHWFDFEKFYAEVRRVAKPNATIAIWAYARPEFIIQKSLDKTFQNFYYNVIGKYWDAERQHIDAHYRTVPFPFTEIQTANFPMTFNWHQYEFEGYLNSWSSVQNFKKANDGFSPIEELMLDMSADWGEFNRETVSFPIFLTLGKVEK